MRLKYYLIKNKRIIEKIKLYFKYFDYEEIKKRIIYIQKNTIEKNIDGIPKNQMSFIGRKLDILDKPSLSSGKPRMNLPMNYDDNIKIEIDCNKNGEIINNDYQKR